VFNFLSHKDAALYHHENNAENYIIMNDEVSDCKLELFNRLCCQDAVTHIGFQHLLLSSGMCRQILVKLPISEITENSLELLNVDRSMDKQICQANGL
jgi:hypothetical protein